MLHAIAALAQDCAIMTQLLPTFSAENTPDGYLPPWEIAKAYALHVVIHHMASEQDCPPHEVVGTRVDDFIATKVHMKGGGHPTRRCIQQLVAKCGDPDWYPGKCAGGERRNRKRVFTERQRCEVARVAMDLKEQLVAPSPRRVRARLLQVSRNPETGQQMSAETMRKPRRIHGSILIAPRKTSCLKR